MKTEHPGVDWLLDCEPRPSQVEALARSYTGMAYRDTRDGPINRRRLRHYGQPAVGWGHFMEMRLGKTPTLLNEFMLFRRDHGMKKLLIYSPNKYKYTWALEIQKFGVDVPVHVFETPQRNKALAFAQSHPEWAIIVNYEALIYKDVADILDQIVDDRTMIGADESVLIKNRNSQIFKNGFEVSKGAAITRPMSGKPTPQGIQDLYSQLRFARKLEGVNFFQFRNSYAIMGGFKGKKVIGVKNEEKLHANALNWYFFARRVDWGTSIASDYETVSLSMTPRQAKAYSEMEQEFVLWLDSGEAVAADQVITKYLKLQQISSGFVYDEFGTVHWIEPFAKAPKTVDLIDRLENYHKDKVIVIAHHKPVMDSLYEVLKPYSPATIRGSQAMKRMGLDVDAEKRRFNEDPSCRVMIGQTKAIKYGHTLMGMKEDPCLSTIYFENTYSLDDRGQTEERNQGEGQQGAINIVDYATTGVENRVIEALKNKEHVASIIMGYYKGRSVPEPRRDAEDASW